MYVQKTNPSVFDIHSALIDILLYTVCGLVLPEPTYQGPENVTYMRGATGLQDELQRDTKVIWLITFYTAWNPSCVNFAPIFSQLSAE